MRHRRLLLLSILLLSAVMFLGMRPFQFASVSVQTTSTPVLGAEVMDDPGFDNPGSWTAQAGWAVSGSSASATGAVNTIVYQTKTRSIGVIYKQVITGGVYTSGLYMGKFGGDYFGSNYDSGGEKTAYMLAPTTASAQAGIFATGTTVTATFSNYSIKPVTLSSLLAPTRPWQSGATVAVTPTTTNCGTGQWLGGSDFVNDTRNPTQGVFWWIDRTTGNMRLKVLTAANTWSADLVNSAFTFTSGQIAKFEYNKTAKTGKIMYNNVQIGATQDLSAYSWIDQNRRHAIYSTTAVVPDSVVYTVTLLQ